MKRKSIQITVVLVVLMVSLMSGCDVIMADQSEDTLEATGTVEAVEVSVSSEVAGIVSEVFAQEGMSVSKGQELLRLENDMLEAELIQSTVAYDAALAGVDASKAILGAAKANLETADVGLELAELQLEIVLKASNMAERPLWEDSWSGDVPNEFELPSWYFSRHEEIAAMDKEILVARENLEIEEENLADTLEDISNADFIATEEQLVDAQAAFLVAEELVDRTVEQNGREAIDDYVESLHESSEAALESAQAEYDSMLSTEKAENILEARARVEVARERYLAALGLAYDLQTGSESLEVKAAELGVAQAKYVVEQAKAALVQAESGVFVAEQTLNQAEAAHDLMKTQVDKLIVTSPIDGVVLARTYEAGELAQPGISLLVLGKLDDLTITVYLSEDVYGKVSLGDEASVTVDSYPNEVFEAEVIRIADKAEYTPRNVQTEEDRRTTVFAIELQLLEGEDKLKPGMPADVQFGM